MKKEMTEQQEAKKRQQTVGVSYSTPEENYNIYLWHHQNLQQLIHKAVLQIMVLLVISLIAIGGFVQNALYAATVKNFAHLNEAIINMDKEILVSDTHFHKYSIQTNKQMVRIQLESDYQKNSLQLVFFQLDKEQKGPSNVHPVSPSFEGKTGYTTNTMREFG